jgi:hypothetical protein
MYADSLGLTDKEYEELRAMSQKPKTSITQIVTAGLFLLITIAAIAVAVTNWGWK